MLCKDFLGERETAKKKIILIRSVINYSYDKIHLNNNANDILEWTLRIYDRNGAFEKD